MRDLQLMKNLIGKENRIKKINKKRKAHVDRV